MGRSPPLIGYALTFAAGFGLGFMYHHIASMAHSAVSSESDNVLGRLHSVEARLAALEAASHVVAASHAAAAASPHHRGSSADSYLPSSNISMAAQIPGYKGRRRAKQAAAAAAMAGRGTASGRQAAYTSLVSEDVAADGQQAEAKRTSGCPAGRKPYHVVLTAQDSPYQAWQTRIMYHHFLKLQKADPCTEMTGFTRLLSSPGGSRDAMSDEMPTVHAKMLQQGSACRATGENTCDMGFPVMNRPHAVTQFLAQLPASLTEEYVLIAETDHIFMKEPKNQATPSRPVCYPFGYMDASAKELRPVVSQWADDPSVVDPCGPSPILIHLPLLRRLTPEWLSLSFQLKRDPTADKIFEIGRAHV